jgi:hypothetical protein
MLYEYEDDFEPTGVPVSDQYLDIYDCLKLIDGNTQIIRSMLHG